MKIIDAKEKNCPIPVIMAKKEMDLGEKVILIEVDNEIAVKNLEKLASSQGFEVSVNEVEGVYKVILNASSQSCEEIICSIEEENKLGDWAVFIGKEIIGSGNEELGKNLMKMFFYTLTESNDIPKYLLFMNDGVKVPTLNEQAIEHLGALQNKGVEILVCGACLNFYGLEDKLTVGRVSNMYEITSAMQEVSKVITL